METIEHSEEIEKRRGNENKKNCEEDEEGDWRR